MLNADATVNGTLYLTNGVFDIGNHTLTITGNVNKTGGSMTGGSNTNVTLSTTSSVPLPPEMNTLTVNAGDGNSVQLQNNITLQSLDVTSGNLDLNGHTISFPAYNLKVSSGGGYMISSFFDVFMNPVSPGVIGTRQSIARTWNIDVSTNGTMTYTLSWNTPADDSGITFTDNKATVYRYVSGSWNLVDTVEFTEDSGVRSLSLPISLGVKAETGDIAICGDEPPVLPVVLSSFTAIPYAQYFVELHWTTQSETNVAGYYLLRNSSDDLAGAYNINTMIPATNTSTETNYSYIDREVSAGTWYYWLQNMDMNGEFDFHGPVSVTIQENNDNSIPLIPLLTGLQNVYPNPFNPVTTITFGLAAPSPVTLDIYNIKGAKVRSLLTGSKNAGTYTLRWDGLNDEGQSVSSGVYYLIMTAGKYHQTQKVVLMK